MHTVPSEAPTGFSATSSTSSSIFMAWQPPAVDSRNGIIQGFKLFVKRKGSDEVPKTLVVTSVSNPQKNVTKLDEFTEYEFQVLAYTSVGDGPKSPKLVARTQKRKGDGKSKYIVVRCYLHFHTENLSSVVIRLCLLI